MKKILLITMLALVPLMAHKSANQKEYKENPYLKKDDFPGGYSLSPNSLPPLIGMYMKMGGQHKINPTIKQEKLFEKQFEKMFTTYHEKAKEIRDLETSLMKRVVYKGQNPKEVKSLLDEIAKKKMDLTILQVECINLFKDNLNDTQYQTILEIAEKFAKENQSQR